jgi:hypothetical protein
LFFGAARGLSAAVPVRCARHIDGPNQGQPAEAAALHRNKGRAAYVAGEPRDLQKFFGSFLQKRMKEKELLF